MNVFISCVATKKKSKCKAQDMYISDLFVKSLQVARLLTSDAHIYILSAKYHILRLNDVIEPYNETLCTKKHKERMEWGRIVSCMAKERNIELNNSIYLVGSSYIEGLLPYLNTKTIKEPLKGLGFGNRLKRLKQIIEKYER